FRASSSVASSAAALVGEPVSKTNIKPSQQGFFKNVAESSFWKSIRESPPAPGSLVELRG
ncbi:hypothetical protein, partial [Mycoplana azooxidifex]|uniref:hypothetical protein n=1 Tax=Mycoplana azooxidifex TaxID=1636188 RepID=UPI001AEDDDA8